MNSPSISYGEIIWFNPDKGYGFIKRKGEKDLFVHANKLLDVDKEMLREGVQVKFRVEQQRNGKLQAFDVRLKD